MSVIAQPSCSYAGILQAFHDSRISLVFRTWPDDEIALETLIAECAGQGVNYAAGLIA